MQDKIPANAGETRENKIWAFIESPITLAALGVLVAGYALILAPLQGSVVLLFGSVLMLLIAAKRQGWFNAASAYDNVARAVNKPSNLLLQWIGIDAVIGDRGVLNSGKLSRE